MQTKSNKSAPGPHPAPQAGYPPRRVSPAPNARSEEAPRIRLSLTSLEPRVAPNVAWGE